MHDTIFLISGEFRIDGRFIKGAPHGNGHIHETYLAEFMEPGGLARYIMQKINREVFKNPAAVMENILMVTGHIKRFYENREGSHGKTLTVIPGKNGSPIAMDVMGNPWRCFLFMENTMTLDTAEKPAHAFEAGSAFGEFQKCLAGLDSSHLHEAIPHFHNSSMRYDNFIRAVEDDRFNRGIECRREIDSICSIEHVFRFFQEKIKKGSLPVRTVHNDTKINNILFDTGTEKQVCVIDLDTVMGGLAHYDFGDLMRTTLSSSPEDEMDTRGIEVSMEMFRALTQGYIKTAGEFLTKAEKELLPISGVIMTMESAARFLTDFLSGDVYFKIHRNGHNLHRCRAQLALAMAMEKKIDEMNRYIEVIS